MIFLIHIYEDGWTPIYISGWTSIFQLFWYEDQGTKVCPTAILCISGKLRYPKITGIFIIILGYDITWGIDGISRVVNGSGGLPLFTMLYHIFIDFHAFSRWDESLLFTWLEPQPLTPTPQVLLDAADDSRSLEGGHDLTDISHHHTPGRRTVAVVPEAWLAGEDWAKKPHVKSFGRKLR